MSNKPKGVNIHPNNNISEIEIKYTAFVRNAVKWAKTHFGYGKHVGSKCPTILKQRFNS